MAQLHMSNEKDKFIDDYGKKIYTTTEENVNLIGKGQIEIKVNVTFLIKNSDKKNIKLREAVLSFKNNLLSVSQITKKRVKGNFYKDGAKVRRR